ncbi:hypothetical protein BGZ83_011284 [Gryganskiella cystojenkinii]|nr:hypothetical protein BGZ83_011284 [Gryganskiella cystojenkinii]
MVRLLVLVTFSISMALFVNGQGAPDSITYADFDPDLSSGYGNDFSDSTVVPVQPITLSPETNFIPEANVQPVVNVLPTNVNDFSGYFDYTGYGDDYGDSSFGSGYGDGAY